MWSRERPDERLQEAAQDQHPSPRSQLRLAEKMAFPCGGLGQHLRGPEKESKPRQIFDHESGLERGGERGRVIADGLMNM